MKITFTAFDGKQFDTMNECMEYEDNFKEVKKSKKEEVIAYDESFDEYYKFYEDDENSLQWEDCAEEKPVILWFRDKEVLKRYSEGTFFPEIVNICDHKDFVHWWIWDDEEEEYKSYDNYIKELVEQEEQIKSKRKFIEEHYEEMRLM